MVINMAEKKETGLAAKNVPMGPHRLHPLLPGPAALFNYAVFK